MKQSWRLAFAANCAALALSASAFGNPHPLPFSYPYQTLPKGKVEVEEIADLIPMRVAREQADGTRDAVTAVRSELQTEVELGVTDRLELGLYFDFKQGATAGTPALRFGGLKQRLRYRFAEEGDWPVDTGVYFELAEYYNEVEIEEKLLLSKRFGYLTAVCNLWVEQEYYFQSSSGSSSTTPPWVQATSFRRTSCWGSSTGPTAGSTRSRRLWGKTPPKAQRVRAITSARPSCSSRAKPGGPWGPTRVSTTSLKLRSPKIPLARSGSARWLEWAFRLRVRSC